MSELDKERSSLEQEYEEVKSNITSLSELILDLRNDG